MYPEFGDVDEIGVASGGSAHVEDHESHRIEKFTYEGVFVSKWACGLKAKGSSNTCVALGLRLIPVYPTNMADIDSASNGLLGPNSVV